MELHGQSCKVAADKRIARLNIIKDVLARSQYGGTDEAA
jgi:hypothetical protein